MLEIDATGLNCPMPVLRLQKALRDIESGARVMLLASDPMAAIDVPHFLNDTGHHLHSQKTEPNSAADGRDLLIFEIEKS